MPRTLVSLGSNLGDADAALRAAVQGLTRLARPGSLVASDPVVTSPVGGPAGQRDFLNAAVAFECDLSPGRLLAELQALEHAHDRQRRARWAARTLDVDLLLSGQDVVDEPGLRIPHPRMSFRPFVLEPAAQVAGDWRHPECGRTLAELLDQLRSGADALLLVGDVGAVRGWVADDRGASIQMADDAAELPAPPRLTIDARPQPSPAPVPGPRLALADCLPEHWRDEVLAAVECVWPRDASLSPRSMTGG